MDRSKNIAKFAIGLGVPGIIAGLFLIFMDEKIIGFSSLIASILITYIGYSQLKNA